jgi:hypothetical protein
MRLRSRVSCAVMAGIGVSSIGAFSAGCIGDDNAATDTDSGVDATMNTPEASAPAPDTGTDATVASDDAGVDASDSAVAVVDTGVDAGIDTGVDAGCSPSLPVAWQPPAYVPATLNPLGPCQHESIDQLYVDCLGDASSPDACAAYDDIAPGYPQCAGCLLSLEDASTYGAAVVRVVPQINLAGCIQLSDTTDAGFACATAVQAVQACAEASCRASCAVTSDPASVAAYIACTTAAAASAACSAWATPAQACVNAEADGGHIPTCFGATAEQVFDDIGVFFCDS